MTKRKTLYIALFLLVSVGVVIAALELTNTTHLFHKDNATPDSTSLSTTSVFPNSEVSKSAPPQNTDGQSSTSGQDDTSEDTKKTVSVTITRANQVGDAVDVNGFVAGVVEDGGTCTLTLKNGSATVKKSRSSAANATNTTCGINSIPVSSLHPGTWQATLSYSSLTSKGVSASMGVQVN